MLNVHEVDFNRADLQTAPVLYILSNIWRLSPAGEIDERVLVEFFRLCQKAGPNRQKISAIIVEYIGRFNSVLTYEEIQRNVRKHAPEGSKMLTYLEQFEQRHYKKGLEEGQKQKRNEIASKMLRRGVDIETIQECTNLTNGELEHLQNLKFNGK